MVVPVMMLRFCWRGDTGVKLAAFIAGGVKDEEMPDAQLSPFEGVGGEPAGDNDNAAPVASGGDQITTAEDDNLQQGEGVAALNGESERLGQSQQPSPPLLEV
jgi:hypothetical protein